MRQMLGIALLGLAACLDFAATPPPACGADCDSPPRPICEGALAGTSCDDEDACTAGDVCDGAGACRGIAKACLSPPAPACTDASTFVEYGSPGQCDSASGECVYPSATTPCPDCATSCLAPCDALACDDDNPCTVDTCAAGACAYAPISGACDDGDLCTFDDTCQPTDRGPSCQGIAILCPVSFEPCALVYTCNGTSTCAASYPGSEVSCDSGSACKVGETCNGAGQCNGAALVCNQGVIVDLSLTTCSATAGRGQPFQRCYWEPAFSGWSCPNDMLCVVSQSNHSCQDDQGCYYGEVLRDLVLIDRNTVDANPEQCPASYTELLVFNECTTGGALCEGPANVCCQQSLQHVLCERRGVASAGMQAIVDVQIVETCETGYTAVAVIPQQDAQGNFDRLTRVCALKRQLP